MLTFLPCLNRSRQESVSYTHLADGEFHMLENREKEGTQYTKAHIDPMLALVEHANDPQEESVAAEAKESAQLFNDNCKAADLVPTTDLSLIHISGDVWRRDTAYEPL